MKITLALAVAVPFVASLPAVFANNHTIECEKLVGPGKLLTQSAASTYALPRKYVHFTKEHTTGGHSLLAEAPNNSTKQQFEFFKCNVSSSLFPTMHTPSGSYVQETGILKSVQHSDKCLTRVKSGDDEENWTLQSCPSRQFVPSELRKQWIQYNGGTLVYRGYQRDPEEQFVAVGNDGVVSLMGGTDGKSLEELILTK